MRGDATTASYARRLLADLTAAAPGAAALAATDPDQGIPQPPARPASPDIWSAITVLAGPLAQHAPMLPTSAPVLKRRVGEVYGTGADSTIRLLLGLHPEIAGSLYPALAGTTVQTPAVRSASALRVKAAPFGTQVPPRVISNDPGLPPQTEEWPVGQASVLTLTVPVALGRHELDWAQLHAALAGQQLQLQVDAPAGQSQQSLRRPGPSSHPTPVRFGADLGEAAVALDQDSLTLIYTGIPDAAFRLEISGPAATGRSRIREPGERHGRHRPSA